MVSAPALRSTLRRIRHRLFRTSSAALPSASRLDQRADLREYEIGRFSWGHLTVSSRGPGTDLRIGQFCSFAYGTHIVLGGEHRTDYVSTYRFPAYPPFNETHRHLSEGTSGSKGTVVVGNDVWLGHQTLILSGVTIGDGAIVGAGSVVRHDIPPYAIVAGNPARVAGFRFSSQQIEALLRLRWWDWSIDRITANLDMLMSENIAEFIAAASERDQPTGRS